MLVITVARRPLDGTVAKNAMVWGCGGMNINASRIQSASPPSPTTAPGWDSINARNAMGGYRESAYQQGMAHYVPSAGGRWPANMILSHLDGCQQAGTVKVKGNRTDTRPDGDGGRSDKTQWRFRPTEATKRGYSGDDGTETVEAWDCQPGCPVAGLDAQSGITRSAVAKEVKVSHVTGQFVQNAMSIPGYNQHGDTGGASRFFKTVKP